MPTTSSTHDNGFHHLLQPLRLGDLQLKNRVVMASLTRNRDSIPRANLHVPYYTERAGCGLIISEAALICPQGTEWTYMPGIYTAEHVAGWKKVTDAVHERGGLIFCQLHHVGRVAHPGTRVQRSINQPVPGPSDVAARGGKFRNVPGAPGYVTPTPIKDPYEYVGLYEHATKCAKEAGFDGVEIHNANGYLPMQFLESHSNKRSDEFGGSIHNRMRFSFTILQALTKYFPYSRIGIKIAPCGGYNDMGELDEHGNPSIEKAKETYGTFCKELEKLGLAYVQVMRWWASYDPMIGGKPRAVEWDPIAYLRPILKNTPLFGNTAFTPEEADQWIQDGKMDAVVIGRPLLYNPDYVDKLTSGRAAEIYKEQPGDEYWWYKWRMNGKCIGKLIY
ncbi:FMN-linked oxidoreductase [Aaosphaeria arxii CBS 175.79]|uniref:FMN-linked oxidoreductase n=1 Tax=Aaosphaeria arxii CBS 175.79 TaxID=1450172 RepID=A0A6A5Y788_9PLEO|nr:FMN-linked oxidoreductase [Aaosphaeria arxii CBS 175.79]KAF2021159.1 FMN-linked oxidoreductase [Aaosphaeria arxii CBS 175.79]